ncbi:Ankyrin repeats (3 copies) [Gemmata sp. SH-PL17]|nr:Ankyrin repeats (3 copies) [Gemmata sp. SH-PL17]
MLRCVLTVVLISCAWAKGQEPVIPRLPPAPGQKANPRVVEVDPYEVALIAATHQFAERGEVDHLRAMLDKHPKWVNERLKFVGNRKPSHGDSWGLLHRAAVRGHLSTVKLLLDKGADIQADGGSGWTPLHFAVSAEKEDVVRLLIDKGADVNAATQYLPPQRIPSGPPNVAPEFSEPVPARTPLDIARGSKRDEIAKFLLSKGAKPANRER